MTVLCCSEDGALFHLPLERAEANLLCDYSGHPSQPVPFKVKRVGDGPGHSLEAESGFLCAEAGGHIAFRPHCATWEIFTLTPARVLDQAKVEARPAFPRRPRQIGIARIIHQTYKTDNIPDSLFNNIDALRRLNPGWSYRYWSDKDCHDFIYQYYGWEILKLYLSINPRYGAARADLFRYLCVYTFGGIYLDIKSGSAVPFDNLLLPDDQFLISQWQNGLGEDFEGFGLHPGISSVPGGEYQQWHIISAAGHPFLEHVIVKVISRIIGYSVQLHGVGGSAVLWTTGPIPYTLAIRKILDDHPHRIFDAQKAGLAYQAIDRRPNLEHGAYQFQLTPLVL